jgi:2'-5' RNA ligase
MNAAQPPAAADPERLRLFFALWPPAAIRDQLHAIANAAAATTGGRVMRDSTLHVTLAFIGSVPREQLPAIAALAASIPGEPFRLRLDRLEALPRKAIVWAACSETPAPLATLVAALKRGLERQCALPTDPRFLPHLTLLRKIRQAAPLPALAAIDWPVSDYRLVCSELTSAGPDYRALGQWPLAT